MSLIWRDSKNYINLHNTFEDSVSRGIKEEEEPKNRALPVANIWVQMGIGWNQSVLIEWSWRGEE